MKKALFIALFALIAAIPARAQFSQILTIQLQNSNGTVAQTFSSPFTLKVGAGCTWSITGTVATFTCAGGGGGVTTLNGLSGAITLAAGTSISIVPAGNTLTLNALPGGAASTVQYNNAGSFGGVTNLTANIANCDGAGGPCQLRSVNPAATFQYVLYGTYTGAPAGNFFDLEQDSGGGLIINSSNGTPATASGLWLLPTGAQLFTGNYGLFIDQPHKSLQISRPYIKASNIVAGDIVLGAGWGSTATVTFNGASTDTNPMFIITANGAGIAADPTAVFTYHDGLFSGGAALPNGICQQVGGTGARSFFDVTSTTTTMTFTWGRGATPVAGLTYIFNCSVMQGQA